MAARDARDAKYVAARRVGRSADAAIADLCLQLALDLKVEVELVRCRGREIIGLEEVTLWSGG